MDKISNRAFLIKKCDVAKYKTQYNLDKEDRERLASFTYPKSVREARTMDLSAVTQQIIKNEPKSRVISLNRRFLNFEIYTDGGYSSVYDAGSWSFIIKARDISNVKNRHSFLFGKESGAIQRIDIIHPIICEIEAVIKSIQYILDNLYDKKIGLPIKIKSIIIKTDSRQISESERLIDRYKDTGWVSYFKGTRLPNNVIDSWRRLDELHKKLNGLIEYEWVRGHSGNLYNECCDKLCSNQIQKIINA